MPSHPNDEQPIHLPPGQSQSSRFSVVSGAAVRVQRVREKRRKSAYRNSALAAHFCPKDLSHAVTQLICKDMRGNQ